MVDGWRQRRRERVPSWRIFGDTWSFDRWLLLRPHSSELIESGARTISSTCVLWGSREIRTSLAESSGWPRWMIVARTHTHPPTRRTTTRTSVHALRIYHDHTIPTSTYPPRKFSPPRLLGLDYPVRRSILRRLGRIYIHDAASPPIRFWVLPLGTS